MVTECIEDSVVPFHLEVTMGRGEPTALDANDVDSTVIDEEFTRLFVTSVPSITID